MKNFVERRIVQARQWFPPGHPQSVKGAFKIRLTHFGRMPAGTIYRCVYRRPPKESFTYWLSVGRDDGAFLLPGHWIVKHESGQYAVLPDQYFKDTYQILPRHCQPDFDCDREIRGMRTR